MAVPITKHGSTAVAGSASSKALVFATDAENETTPSAFPTGYTVNVIAIPDWATSIRVSVAPSTTGVTFAFGTATGTGGGTLYWIAHGYKLT